MGGDFEVGEGKDPLNPVGPNTDMIHALDRLEHVEELLPEQTHMFGGGQLHLSYMTDKWIMKKLKQNPHINNYKELKDIYG